jgi:hypothetical protein
MKFLAIGFVGVWLASRGGFSIFFMFLLFMFVCMALKSGRGGWYNMGCSPQHNQGRGPDQPRQAWPEDARPHQGQPGAPGAPYYGGSANEGTPTIRTDMHGGAGTVRVDRAPGSTGEPTTPLREQPRPEEPRARVEH